MVKWKVMFKKISIRDKTFPDQIGIMTVLQFIIIKSMEKTKIKVKKGYNKPDACFQSQIFQSHFLKSRFISVILPESILTFLYIAVYPSALNSKL